MMGPCYFATLWEICGQRGWRSLTTHAYANIMLSSYLERRTKNDSKTLKMHSQEIKVHGNPDHREACSVFALRSNVALKRMA